MHLIFTGTLLHNHGYCWKYVTQKSISLTLHRTGTCHAYTWCI